MSLHKFEPLNVALVILTSPPPSIVPVKVVVHPTGMPALLRVAGPLAVKGIGWLAGPGGVTVTANAGQGVHRSVKMVAPTNTALHWLKILPSWFIKLEQTAGNVDESANSDHPSTEPV